MKRIILVCLVGLALGLMSFGCGAQLSKKTTTITNPPTATKAIMVDGREVPPGASAKIEEEETDGAAFYKMVQAFEKQRKPLLEATAQPCPANATECKGITISGVKHLKIYQTRPAWPVQHQWTDQRWKYGAQMLSTAGAVITGGILGYFGYKTADAIVKGAGGFGSTPSIKTDGQAQINIRGGVNTGPVTGPTGGPGGSVGDASPGAAGAGGNAGK